MSEIVHNHPPYRPVCNERRLPDEQLRGACLNDDGSGREDRAADALREKVAEAATAYLSLYGLPANAPVPFDPPTYKAIAARIGPLCADAVLAALEPLLAAERERAWDEGWSAAYTMARNWGHVDGWEDEWPDNPYRTEPGAYWRNPGEWERVYVVRDLSALLAAERERGREEQRRETAEHVDRYHAFYEDGSCTDDCPLCDPYSDPAPGEEW